MKQPDAQVNPYCPKCSHRMPCLCPPFATGIEAQVCDDITARQQKGIAKYGVTVADNPLSRAQWRQHLYEELLDAVIYLKREMEAENNQQEKP